MYKTQVRTVQEQKDAAQPSAKDEGLAPVGQRSAEEPHIVMPGDRLERVLLGIFGALIAFLLLQVLMYEYGRDQGIYSVVAEAMRTGGAPYRDAWDFKPPGIFLIYAVAKSLFGAHQHAVRILEVMGFASIVYAFTVLSRRFVGDWKPGLVSGLIAVLIHAQLEFWHTAQPESFGAVALVWAMVCATYRAPDGASAWKQLASWATAGALITSSALLKPPLGGAFIPSLLLVCWAEYKRADRSLSVLIKPVLCYSAGGALVVGSTALYFLAKGALGDLHHTLFVFTPYYTKLSFERRWFWGYVYQAFEQWLASYSGFTCVGIGLLIGFRTLGPREREGIAHVIGMLVFQIIGIGMQAKFFPYHYGAALPFGALLAGWGFWKCWKRVRSSTPLLIGLLALVYVTGDGRGATRDLADTFLRRCWTRMQQLVSDPAGRQRSSDHLYSVADVNAQANRHVAEWLAQNTPADKPIFIWGFEPVIYEESGRRWASRYIYNVPQRVSWAPETREALMSDLERNVPSAIVVEHRDVFPSVTGNRFDSADSLQDIPRLAAMIDEGYVLAHSIEDFDIYLKRQ